MSRPVCCDCGVIVEYSMAILDEDCLLILFRIITIIKNHQQWENLQGC